MRLEFTATSPWVLRRAWRLRNTRFLEWNSSIWKRLNCVVTGTLEKMAQTSSQWWFQQFQPTRIRSWTWRIPGHLLSLSQCVPTNALIIEQFTYPASNTQIVFLRLLSTSASQRFTFHCDNTTAWYSHSTGNYQNALRFEGSNGDKFSLGSKDRPKVHSDKCDVSTIPRYYRRW